MCQARDNLITELPKYSYSAMDRSKIVAIITGVFSLLLAIAYLLIVQILDFRGDMVPAPQSQVHPVDFPVAVVWQKGLGARG